MNAPLQPKDLWLIRMRLWHRWIGVVAALFMLIFSTTGIILNYKKPILGTLGLLPGAQKEGGTQKTEKTPFTNLGANPTTHAVRGAGQQTNLHLTTATHLDQWPVSPQTALAMAQTLWGHTRVEKLELKTEDGRWTWKVKHPDGAELLMDAATGGFFVKGRYEKVVRSDPTGAIVRQTDWGKVLLDLHTGKIAGEWGKALMTLAGALLMFLTVSGLYVWLKPLLVRKQQSALRKTQTPPISRPNPTEAQKQEPVHSGP
jgi:uncharacterized iron-regulated membrane protein